MNRSFKTLILTFSPHGNTKAVAETIRDVFRDERLDVSLIDLTGTGMEEIRDLRLRTLPSFDLLIIAAPVYGWKIILPLEVFLSGMPKQRGKYAALAVTYGGVTSGHALHNAARLLERRGLPTLGAVKVAASHSNVLDEKKDPFIGHPNASDHEKVADYARGLIGKMREEAPDPISPDDLRPQFVLVRLMSKTYLSRKHSRKFPPGIQFDDKKCIQCGRCVKACPLNILTLDPYPAKNGTCIKCHNCKRVCPQNAVKTTGLWRKVVFHLALQRLHSLPFIRGEKPMTQIFLGKRGV
jgi:ferredoxin